MFDGRNSRPSLPWACVFGYVRFLQDWKCSPSSAPLLEFACVGFIFLACPRDSSERLPALQECVCTVFLWWIQSSSVAAPPRPFGVV